MRIRRFARFSAAFLTLAAGALAWRAAASPDDPLTPPTPTPARYQLTGKVLDEEGRPASGASIGVATHDLATGKAVSKSTRSGPDGAYAIDLPPGHFAFGLLGAPPACQNLRFEADSVPAWALSDSRPTFRQDFRVKRGVPWDFRLAHDGRHADHWGVGVVAAAELDLEGMIADADGLARLGLPRNGGKVELIASTYGPRSLSARGSVRWDDDFRPEAVRSITKLEGEPSSYWITDVDGRSALFESVSDGRLTPGIEDGRLVIRIALPEDSTASFPAIEGKVMDRDDRPVAGARVEAFYVSSADNSMSDGDDYLATTDDLGRFRLARIPMPRRGGGFRPSAIRLSVTRDGFAAVDSEPIPIEGDGPKIAPPIVLEPGHSVTGVVLDPEGRPVEGAEVEPGVGIAAWARCTWTDAEGRFTVIGLSGGKARLKAHYGELSQAVEALAAERDPQPIEIRLQKR